MHPVDVLTLFEPRRQLSALVLLVPFGDIQHVFTWLVFGVTESLLPFGHKWLVQSYKGTF